MFVKMMMMIESQEEVVACNKDQLQIIKGKRTKRPRPLSPPPPLPMASTTTTATNSDDSRGFDPAFASPATSVELTETSTIEEEEDLANCLILLAQGQTRNKPMTLVSEPVSLVPTTTTTASNKSFQVHQCKTCNRCFPSFQALGGHRASHKKPKVVNVDHQEQSKGSISTVVIKEDDDLHQQFNSMNTTLSLQLTNNKSKVHECSICGAEFSSGQALGGHMRRHRTLNNPPMSVEIKSCPESDDQSKKPRTILQLDLNLPAPEDEVQRETKFSFPSKEKLTVFSAPSLVDCHY